MERKCHSENAVGVVHLGDAEGGCPDASLRSQHLPLAFLNQSPIYIGDVDEISGPAAR